MTVRKEGSLEPDVRCNAVRKDGGICRQPAGRGTDHIGFGRCSAHGGLAPSYGKHITARRLREEAVAIYGGRQATNPFLALLREVEWTAGHVEWLRQRVAESENADDLLKSRRGWLALYRAERKHLVFAAKTAIDAGVAERLVTLAERDARHYAETVAAAADRVGLTTDQRCALMREIAAGLRGDEARTAIGSTAIETTASEAVPLADADQLAEWATDDDDDELDVRWSPGLRANVTVVG